ncbi:MAG: pilus assembly protein [Rhodanobacteraceae bacterium]|nr:MAG: pilus assembly protein [Rhodanobacteraceae bacterium]
MSRGQARPSRESPRIPLDPPSCGRGRKSSAHRILALTPFHRKGVAPQARGDVTPFHGKGVARSAGGCHAKATQRGAALLVSLILLVVITLVGLAAIGTTLLQNKAAANQYDRQIAFQAAEASLRQAQVVIQNATTNVGMPVPSTTLASAGIEDCHADPIPGTSPQQYNPPVNKCLADPFTDPNSTGYVVTVTTTQFNAGPLAAANPQYVIQYMGSFLAPTPQARLISNPPNYGVPSQGTMVDYYRITARSGDPTQTGERSIVTLQSTFMN